MNKRRNLFLLAFLFGSLTKLLPFILWLICVVPIAVCLFLAFDFWEYERRVRGAKWRRWILMMCSELIEIEHLLFFLGETLESIQDTALDYRKLKSEPAKMLIYFTNRNINQLVTLQIILVSKVTDLEKVV